MRLIPFLLAAAAFCPYAPAAPAADRTYTVQVGAYNNLRKAAIIRAVLANIGPARVEKLGGDEGAPMYRVLVGSFKSIEEAETFARESRLKTLFPELWLNPMSSGPAISDEELGKDPYRIDLALHCEQGKKWGKYQVVMQPEEKTADNEVAVSVHWNCIPNAPENWLARDTERNPSHWSIAPVAGFGGMSTEDSSTSRDAFNFSYGIQLGAFKSFGGMGPTLEYRFLNHRYSGAQGMSRPMFVVENRLLVGARLPFRHSFEVEPLFGFMNHQFMLSPTPATIRVESALVPQAGLKARYRLVEMSDRAFFDLTGGYHYLFGSRGTLNVGTGSILSVTLRARHFFPSTWGTDWFAEYSSTSQTANGSDQSESRMLVGLTFMILW